MNQGENQALLEESEYPNTCLQPTVQQANNQNKQAFETTYTHGGSVAVNYNINHSYPLFLLYFAIEEPTFIGLLSLCLHIISGAYPKALLKTSREMGMGLETHQIAYLINRIFPFRQ